MCIIPARGGSTRIPGKNYKLFHGKPIIAYSIEKALASNLFDAIHVSTDSEEIQAIANDYGVGVINRAPDLCENEVGTQQVIQDACIALALANDDLVMGMYATCPLIPVQAIAECLAGLLMDNLPYCKTTDDEYRDIGALYWGRAWAFKGGLPLSEEYTGTLPLDEQYCCDINTPEDWERALRMYENN